MLTDSNGAKVGGSFTGSTVNKKEVLAWMPSASETEMDSGTVPCWLRAGVAISQRFAPVPPNARLVLGTKLKSEEPAVTTKLLTRVSVSPTVNGTWPVLPSSEMVW
jgi:hypothetical protein